jgi:hypothetical protein
MSNSSDYLYQFKTVNRCVCIKSIITGIDADRDKDFFFPGESHSFWEAVFVSEGEITATADERIYKLKQGMLLFHKPMEFHRLIADGKNSSHLKIISFTAEGELMKSFENRCFNLSFSEQDAFSEISDYFIKAYLAYSDAPDRFDYISNTAVTLLEGFLLRLKEKKEYTPRYISYNEDIYYKIVNLIDVIGFVFYLNDLLFAHNFAHGAYGHGNMYASVSGGSVGYKTYVFFVKVDVSVVA